MVRLRVCLLAVGTRSRDYRAGAGTHFGFTLDEFAGLRG